MDFDIDTLLISGGGTKGNIIIGSLKALTENNIIKNDYSNLKNIISCSVGSIIAFFICCGLTPSTIFKLSNNINYNKLINYNDLDNLLFENGLFKNDKIVNVINTTLYKLYGVYDLTLLNFYKLTNIKFISKVYNLNEKKSEYISYKTNPDLKLSILIKMTTCIPILFKPVIYKNKYYIDGGMEGSFVDNITNSDKYIGIYIYNKNKDIYSLNKNNNFINYLFNVINAITYRKVENSNKIIYVYNKNNSFVDFEIKKENKLDDYISGYKQTIIHINEYLRI